MLHTMKVSIFCFSIVYYNYKFVILNTMSTFEVHTYTIWSSACMSLQKICTHTTYLWSCKGSILQNLQNLNSKLVRFESMHNLAQLCVMTYILLVIHQLLIKKHTILKYVKLKFTNEIIKILWVVNKTGLGMCTEYKEVE